MEQYQPVTTAQVSWGIYDPDAKRNATFIAQGDIKPYVHSDLREFNRELFTPEKYATMEPGYWYGDGSFRLMPEPPEYDGLSFGLWSYFAAVSNWWTSEISWPNPGPSMTVEFSEPVSSTGLTLRFDTYENEYPTWIQVDWFLTNSTIITEQFQVDNSVYFVNYPVDGYIKLTVTPRRAMYEGQLFKMFGIDFGEERTLSSELVSATVLEEVDPICATLPIATAEITFIDDNITMLDPDKLAIMFQKRQPIRITGSIDGTDIDMGTYYLTEWENGTDGVHKMRMEDYLGILQGIPYNGGLWAMKNVGELIADIFAIIDPYNERYRIDDGTAAKAVAGWLPATDMRDALHQILFASQAAASTARTNGIYIYTSSHPLVNTVGFDRRSMEQEIIQQDVVDGTMVNSFGYIESDGQQEATLIDADFPAGTHKIIFSEPMYNRQIDFDAGSGATVVEEDVNYITFNLPIAGYVYMTGYPYLVITHTHTAGQTQSENASRHILEVTDAHMLSLGPGDFIADNVYEWYSKRYINTFSMRLNPGEMCDQRWKVMQKGNKAIDGYVTQLETDVVGGFITRVTLRGDIVNA